MDFEGEMNCEAFFVKIDCAIKKLTKQGVHTSYTNLHINWLHNIEKYAASMGGVGHIFSNALTQWHAKSDVYQMHDIFKTNFGDVDVC